MNFKDYMPLDINEVQGKEEEQFRNPFSSLIELVPISIIAGGLLLRYLEISWWTFVVAAGGGLAVICYLLLSWYMFKVQRYVLLEVLLSILFGILFTAGILGIILKIKYWQWADQFILSAIYGGGSLTLCAFVLFIIHFRDDRASIFYRTLLSRLLVMSAILFRVYIEF